MNFYLAKNFLSILLANACNSFAVVQEAPGTTLRLEYNTSDDINQKDLFPFSLASGAEDACRIALYN